MNEFKVVWMQNYNCDRILENSSKSDMKCNVFNDISIYVYVFP